MCLQYKNEIMSLCKQTSKKRRHQKVQNNSPYICPLRCGSQWTGCDRCNQMSPVLCCPVSPHHLTGLGWSYGTEAQHTMLNSFVKYTLAPKSIITTQWGLVEKSKPHLAIHKDWILRCYDIQRNYINPDTNNQETSALGHSERKQIVFMVCL